MTAPIPTIKQDEVISGGGDWRWGWTVTVDGVDYGAFGFETQDQAQADVASFIAERG